MSDRKSLRTPASGLRTGKGRWALAESLKASMDAGTGDFTNVGAQSGYEGAQSTSARSSFLQFPINSRRELNRLTRIELLRKIRALDANLPLINRIKQTIRRRSVGTGIALIPTTKDVEWNNLSRKSFENWGSFPEGYSVDASRDLWEDQALAAESMPADGEFFEALVSGPGGTPMVQPLDPFEIDARGSPGWEDGIWKDDYQRPGFYAVRELPGPPAWSNASVGFRSVPADSMIHLFQRRRAKQGRGITWFFSGINHGIDALDLTALISGTAKLHSGLAVTVNKSGKKGKKGAFDKLRTITERGGSGDEGHWDTKALERIYGGGMIAYLGENGELDLKSSAFPQTNLIDFRMGLYFDVAAALGISLQAVYDMAELGGANMRGTNDDAQMFFDLIQDKIFWRHTRRIYLWKTSRAVKSGALRACKDPEWWACKSHGPAKLTPDNGRTAQSQVLLLNNGALSHPRLFDERGQDAYEEMMEEILFQKWLKETCAANGVDVTAIIKPVPGALPQNGNEDNPPPAPAPPAPPKKK